MANKSLTIDKAEFGAVMRKIKELGLVEEDFHQELAQTAEDIQREARAKFQAGALPQLERRGEETRGLTSSIKARKMKRKGSETAYQISAGGRGKEIMAYSEFGTRSRSINLQGIRSLFGGQGDAYAKRFKGGNNPRSFTHLFARPYFFNTIFVNKKAMMKRLGKRVSRALQK